MDISRLTQTAETEWRIEPTGAMRVPGIVYADRALLEAMDDKVTEQVANVASLPGIVAASYAMPDAHWGYGFPIGGVAAFDADAGGIVSAGGVGFDISCGVRLLLTGIKAKVIDPLKDHVAGVLYASVPAGVGSTGNVALTDSQMTDMLTGGARWAVRQGYGHDSDLDRIEDYGCVEGAWPDAVSDRAKIRQRRELGTLGSGNHYLEIQEVGAVYDDAAARSLGLHEGDAVISIHCGSRGLGHQIGTDYLREMAIAAAEHGIVLPDLELACAPIKSPLGQRYLGAMRAAANCALANRQILTHLVRSALSAILPEARLELMFDVSHNICREESHLVDGKRRRLFVHRKGATRAFGPGHSDLPAALRTLGQPVFIGGSMGTASHVMLGAAGDRAFGSACHGAGRSMSRHQAAKRWRGRAVVNKLAQYGIVVRSPSLRGIAEEAPGAYKDVDAVVEVAERCGLARRIARLVPRICIKG